ncbi:MAG: DUF2914 domain-containing protein [Bacteroidia bacterium]
MKTIYALFSSALATIALCLMGLILTACERQASNQPGDAAAPVVPATLVYSIDAPSGFDRSAIRDTQPGTFKVQGRGSEIRLNDAFAEEQPDGTAFNNDIVVTNEINVMDAKTCHDVVARNPIDESAVFQAENGRVWLYTQVSMAENAVGLIDHVWKHEGREHHRETLFVEGPTFRTSSFTTMNANLKGKWTVDITTDNGQVLETVEFEVL